MVEKITPLLILVVEDDFLVRQCIVDWLRRSGHVVIEATTGEEAIALLHAQVDEPINALFTDIQLGGRLNGWDVAEVSRAADPKVPVLYTSGNSSDRNRQVSNSLFFNKPYRPADILRAIEGSLAA